MNHEAAHPKREPAAKLTAGAGRAFLPVDGTALKNMKTKFILILLAASLFTAAAQSLTPLVNYQAVNGSVTGTVATVTSRLPSVTLQFQSGGITNRPVYVTNIVGTVTNVVNTITNALPTVSYLSLDNVNFIAFATNRPPSTNSGVYPFYVSGTLPIYLKTVVTTTNALNAGLMLQK